MPDNKRVKKAAPAVYRLTILFLLFLIFVGGKVFAADSPASSDTDAAGTNTAGTNAAVSGANTADNDSGAVPDEETIPANGTPVEGEPSFRLSGTENSMLFFQRISWDKAQYAVRYTVILERKGTNLDIYTEVLKRNLDAADTFIDVSIPAGDYRYRVLSFNVLGLLDSETDWEYFLVLPALQPSIVDFTPQAFYFDRLAPRIITITGENLLVDAEIYLVSKTALDENGQPVVLKPRDILRNELGETARLIFNEEDLIAGSYDIVVKDPGGLETRAGDFVIAMAKPYDINVSLGYIPMFTLYGEMRYFLDHIFDPLGFSARGSFIPFKWDFGNLGFEMNTSWSYLTSQQKGFITRANLVLINAGGVFQYWIIRRELSLNGRAGIGFAGIFDYHFKFDTGRNGSSINTGAFSFFLGSSVQWLFFKQFFVEGGLDFVLVAHPEIPMGFVRLGLFGGYQF